MLNFELFLLGKPNIKPVDGLRTSLQSSQISQLLVYLCTKQDQHSYQDLVDMFEDDTSRILHELRRRSEKLVGLGFDDYIQREVDSRGRTVSVQIRSKEMISNDALEFEALLQDWSQKPNPWDDKSLGLLEHTIDMYRGEFLQGFSSNYRKYNIWLNTERYKYRYLAAWAILQLMFACWSNNSLAQARTFGELWLVKDNINHVQIGWITYFLMCIAYWNNQPDRAVAIHAEYEANLKKQQSQYPFNRDIVRWVQIDNLLEQIQQEDVHPIPVSLAEWETLQRRLGIEIPPSLTKGYTGESVVQIDSVDSEMPEIPLTSDKNGMDIQALLQSMSINSQMALNPSQMQRNRQAILQQIRSFWIEGFLDDSLSNVPTIDLRIRTEPSRVTGLQGKLDTANRLSSRHSYQEIDTLFERYNRKMLILGEAGAGKTTILLNLTKALLEKAEADMSQPIPIVFMLSSWNQEQQTLENWLIEELSTSYSVPHKIAQQWIETDALILLLDGLDEVEAHQQESCLRAIDNFRARHGLVDIAISCRIEDYANWKNPLRLNGAVLVETLTQSQIEQFLDEAAAMTNGMMQFIERNPMLHDLFQSPLVLNLLVKAFSKDSGEHPYDARIDDDEQLFSHFITRMYDRHMRHKPYSQEELAHYLSHLAQQMEQHSDQIFHIESLQPEWLSQSKQSIFHHLNWISTALLAAFFSFISSMTGSLITGITIMPEIRPIESLFMFMALMWLFFSRNQLWRKPLAHLLPGIMGALGVFIHFSIFGDVGQTLLFAMTSACLRYSMMSFIGGIMFSLFQTRTDWIKPSEKLIFSLEAVNWRGGLLGVISGIVLNLLYLSPNTELLSPKTILGMVISGLFIGLAVFLLTGFRSIDVPMRTVPNQAIHASRNNALRICLFSLLLMIGLFSGLIVTTTFKYAMWRANVFGLFLMYPLWFVYGGLAVQQHYLLRFMLEQEGRIPRDFRKFLDFAVALILMRRVGGGYTFIHKSLQDYFVDNYQET